MILCVLLYENFHPYYKIKNNIQGFSTRTKKKRAQPPASPHFQSGARIFFIAIPGKTGSSFFSFLQYQYSSVFHKHCAFQCFTETNGHWNNVLNDIYSKKNCNRAHFRLRHQRMYSAHVSVTLKILRR